MTMVLSFAESQVPLGSDRQERDEPAAATMETPTERKRPLDVMDDVPSQWQTGCSPSDHSSRQLATASDTKEEATFSGEGAAATDAAATDATVTYTADSAASDATVTDTAAAAAASDEPAAKRRALCGVCHTEAAKYKCPRCRLGYCSVSCSRVHRDSHPSPQSVNVPPSAARSSLPTSTTSTADHKPAAAAAPPSLPPHPFSVLDNAPALGRLFAKYPNLPARLHQIYETTLPPSQQKTDTTTATPTWADRAASAAGGHRGRGGRARGGRGGGRGGRGRGAGSGSGSYGDRRLSPEDRQKESGPWTKEMGLRLGLKALRRARVDPGEDGDAVREYCEAITYLLLQGGAGATSASTPTQPVDAVAIVQQEVAQADAKLVEQMLRAEKARF